MESQNEEREVLKLYQNLLDKDSRNGNLDARKGDSALGKN